MIKKIVILLLQVQFIKDVNDGKVSSPSTVR
mgnify:CR=1 FL=1